jgi:hypothetical protein
MNSIELDLLRPKVNSKVMLVLVTVIRKENHNKVLSVSIHTTRSTVK